MMVGGGGESILPAGYTRLQYIYNTSDAYINTGVAVGSTDKIVFAYKKAINSSNTDNKAIWGAYQSSSMHCWVNDYKNAEQVYFRWGGKSSSNYNYTKSSALDITVENNVFTWEYNGETKTWSSGAGTFQMTTPITLFARNNGNALGNICQNRGITKFEIVGKWNGIPCINDNNVVGMYDTVSQTFFSSPNGTAFIAGPNY